MAISTTFKQVEREYNPIYWESIDAFEDHYLRHIQETMTDRNFYTDRNGVEIAIDCINHFPKLKEYEVWIEGRDYLGRPCKASFLGKVMARNFRQACDIIMCQRHLEYVSKNNTTGTPECSTYCGWSYNPNKLSDWGARLYWSEDLANINLK